MVNLKLEFPKKGSTYVFKPLNLQGQIPIFKIHYIPEIVIPRDRLKIRQILCETELGKSECKFCKLSETLRQSGLCFEIQDFLLKNNLIKFSNQFRFDSQYIAYIPSYFYETNKGNFWNFKIFVLNQELLNQFYEFITDNNLFDITDIVNNKLVLQVKVSEKSTFKFDEIKTLEIERLGVPLLKTPQDVENDLIPLYKQIYEYFNLEPLKIINNPQLIDVIYREFEERINKAVNVIKNSKNSN